MDKRAKFKKLSVVCVTEFLMMYLSLKVMRFPLAYFSKTGASEAVVDLICLALFLIPILVCLVYMKLTYPEKLRIFTAGGSKNSLRGLGIGLAIGSVMNVTLCLASMFSGSVTYRFAGVNPLLFVALAVCFIQCASEEVLIRGYATAYLEDSYPDDVVALTGGTLFVLHHIGNLKAFGFSTVFCLNVFLLGILLYLAVKLTGSIWTAFGIHTAWNYSQSFIFGSENSGTASTLAFFSSEGATDSFFCNTVYGNEGTWFCVLVVFVVTAMLYGMYRKTKQTV